MSMADGNPFGMSDADIGRLMGLSSQVGSYTVSGFRNNRMTRACSGCNNRGYTIFSSPTHAYHWCQSCVPSRSISAEESKGCGRVGVHQWGFLPNGASKSVCIGCAGLTITNHKKSSSLDDFKNTLTRIENKQQEKSNEIRASQIDKAEPYINSGLAEPFALAIVNGVSSEDVLDLWEASWWKQYPPDDVLIVSVLEGVHTEEDARKINTFRGEHPELGTAAIKKSISVEWASMLLDAGFEEHPEAVRDVLKGGNPSIIARIRQMEINHEALPPELLDAVLLMPSPPKNSSSPAKSGRKAHVNHEAELEFLMREMNEDDWKLLGKAFENPRSRRDVRKIYVTNWLPSKSTKAEIQHFASLFNIPGRSKMPNKVLLEKVRQRAQEIRREVRRLMDQ
jgi:hypothetical protein